MVGQRPAGGESDGHAPSEIVPLIGGAEDTGAGWESGNESAASELVEECGSAAGSRPTGRSLPGWRAATSAALATLLLAGVWRTCGFGAARLRGVVGADEKEKKWEPIDFGKPRVDIKVLYIPEISKEHERLEQMRLQFDRYVYGGRKLMSATKGADPDFWPKRGRLSEVRAVCEELEPREHWWDVVYPADPVHMVRQGLNHHVGCTGSHLMAWADARRRKAPGLIVSEVDGGLFAFQRSTGGCKGDMMAIINAAYDHGPTLWHVIRFDMGRHGANPYVHGNLDVHGTTGRYHLFHWVARGGEAGASFYMVSRRFLKEFPEMLRKHPVQMVDSWLDALCKVGDLDCYSVAAEKQIDYWDCPDFHAADP